MDAVRPHATQRTGLLLTTLPLTLVAVPVSSGIKMLTPWTTPQEVIVSYQEGLLVSFSLHRVEFYFLFLFILFFILLKS